MSDATSDPVSASAASLPLACSLTGDDLRRRGNVVGDLFQHATQVRELADGYQFAFPGGDESARALLDFIVEERACCPFFTFELASVSPHDALWLTIRGDNGVKALVVPFVEKAAMRGATA
jgi:hypothetical protein